MVHFYPNIQYWEFEFLKLESEDFCSYKLQRIEGQDSGNIKAPQEEGGKGNCVSTNTGPILATLSCQKSLS